MKNIRCCDCGWLLEKDLECTAPCPDCLPDSQALRLLSAGDCIRRRDCDCYTSKEPANVQP